MIMKTFKEWSSLGFRIKKGTKGKRAEKGETLFSRDQVYQPCESWITKEYPNVDHDHPEGEDMIRPFDLI